MLAISKAKAYLCDLPVASPRTDATQAFLKQETVFVEVETADEAWASGTPTRSAPAVQPSSDRLEGYLLEQVIGEDASRPEALWQKVRGSTQATMIGAITALGAGSDRYRRLGPARPCPRRAAVAARGWRAEAGSAVRHRGGMAPSSADQSSCATPGRRRRWPRFPGGQGQGGQAEPSRGPSARLTGSGRRSARMPALMADANQAFTRDEAVRAPGCSSPWT